MATPQEALNSALLLQENEQIKISFPNAKKLNSFRVRLYKIKEADDEKSQNIQISRRGKFLILFKGIKEIGDDSATIEVTKRGEIFDEENLYNEERDDFKEILKDNDAKDYNVIAGKRADKLHTAMSTLFQKEIDEITAKHQDLIIALSLDDSLSAEEKKAIQREIAEAINIEKDEFNLKRKKIVESSY